MFDSGRAFGMQVPLLAQTSPALLYAVLALSARQMERKEAFAASNGVGSSSRPVTQQHQHHHHRQQEQQQQRPAAGFDSLEFYQEAIRLLTPLLQARNRAVLPICVILCCLEMMSASAQDWRRHLEGCAALFDAFGVHGFYGGLLQAVFWCYARMGTAMLITTPRYPLYLWCSWLT